MISSKLSISQIQKERKEYTESPYSFPWVVSARIFVMVPLTLCNCLNYFIAKMSKELKTTPPWEILGDPVVKLCLPKQGVWVRSPVGELRSHMPCRQKTKT